MRRDGKYWQYVKTMQDPRNWVGHPEARWFHWQLCPGGNPMDGHGRWPDDPPKFARECVRCFILYVESKQQSSGLGAH